MAPSLVALNQKAVNIVLFYFSGNNVWKNEKQEPKKADKKKSFFSLEVHPDTVSRGQMGFWLRTLPEVQTLHTEALPPAV